MTRHWPIAAGALLLAAAAAYLASRPEGAERPRTSADPSPAAGGGPSEQAPAPDPPSSRVPAKKPGRLTVVVESAAPSLSGTVGVVSATGFSDGRRDVRGEGRVEAVFEALPPGPKRVVFVPARSLAPAFGSADVPEGGATTVTLRPEGGRSFSGRVVDALQRPLAGAKVAVTAAGASLPQAQATKATAVLGGSRTLAGPGGRAPSSGYSLLSDGRLLLTSTTNEEGRFAIEGVSGTSVEVEVRFEKERFTQACLTDQEALLVVPVQKAPVPPDFAAEDFRRAVDRLLKLMVEHPESEPAYWMQLKDLLQRSVEESQVSAKDKALLREMLQKTESVRKTP